MREFERETETKIDDQGACPTCGCPREAGEVGVCYVCGAGEIAQTANAGMFGPGNEAARRHGAYAMRRQTEQAPVRADLRARLLADQGMTETDVPVVMSTVIDQLIEARMIAIAYFEYLAASGGPISAKGRQRRAVDGYLRAAAVVEKLGRTLGLRRQSRSVTPSPSDWLAAGTDTNADSEPTHTEEA